MSCWWCGDSGCWWCRWQKAGDHPEDFLRARLDSVPDPMALWRELGRRIEIAGGETPLALMARGYCGRGVPWALRGA